jgi:acyl-CoA thioesterase
MEYKFDRDIHVERERDNLFVIEISSDWNIVAPHGGYLMAIAGNVFLETTGFKFPLSMTAYYHRPTLPGKAILYVDRVMENKRLVTAKIALIQDDTEIISFIGTFTRENAFKGLTIIQKQPLLPDPNTCIELPLPRYPFFNQVKLCVPPAQFSWLDGDDRGETCFSGYFSFQDDRPLDGLAVLLLADASPPPILRYTGPVQWVPTIEMSVQVRTIPSGTSLGFLSSTNFVTNGLTETDVELWSEKGEIVAIGRQLAVIRENNRNT